MIVNNAAKYLNAHLTPDDGIARMHTYFEKAVKFARP